MADLKRIGAPGTAGKFSQQHQFGKTLRSLHRIAKAFGIAFGPNSTHPIADFIALDQAISNNLPRQAGAGLGQISALRLQQPQGRLCACADQSQTCDGSVQFS
jgi:hypothetical protein